MFNKTLINFRPFFFFAVSISLGIGAGYLFYFDKVFYGIMLCFVFLLFSAFVILFSGEDIKHKLFFGVGFLVLFVFGLGAFCAQVSIYDNANLDGHYYEITGKITYNETTDYGQIITLEKVNIKGNRTGKLKYGVNVYIYGDSKLQTGDMISFQSSLIDLGAIYEGRLSATNIERGIKYTASIQAEEILKTESSPNIFERVNLFMRSSIKEGMDEKESAVVIALLLGGTEEIDGEVINSYRSAGVAHIFAVSGLHIGFLATALNFLFNKLRINRLLKAILITFALFFYSGVCGFSASSIRASVMSAVLLFSSIKGNRYDGLSSVGIACTLLLICSPIHLFCVGFQLSFVVVIGILLLSSPIARILRVLPKKLASALGVVLSAQAVGIPICLYAFKEFSTIAILANLVFVPIVGALFIFLFIATVVGGLFGISQITLFLSSYAIKGINFLITAIDYEIFLVGGFTFGIFAVCYYLALILPCGLINLKKVTKLISSIFMAVICLVGTTVISVQDSKASKAYVIGDEKVCATVIKSEEETVMIVSSVQKVFSINRFKRLSERENITKIDTLIFTQSVQDMPSVITRFNQVFELEKVSYYGLTDIATETVIRKSFGLNVRSFNAEEKLFNNANYFYALNGYAVECIVKDKRLVVFAEFGKYLSGYEGLENEYDYMVVVDYAQSIYETYQPKEFFCYRNNATYKNAFSSGTVTIKVK